MEAHPTLPFKFTSLRELEIHLKIRAAIIKRIIQLENAWTKNGDNTYNTIANYPSGQERYDLPIAFWGFTNKLGGFITHKNKSKRDAVNSIMKSGSGTILDCNRMSVAIAYTALSDAVKKEEFEELFSLNNITIGEWQTFYEGDRISMISQKYFKEENLYSDIFSESSIKSCIPGDIVYFKNDPSYKEILGMVNQIEREVRSGNERYLGIIEAIYDDPRYDTAWTGEFCICTNGNAKDLDSFSFASFGLRNLNNSQVNFSSLEVREELLSKAIDMYNLVKEKGVPIWKNLNGGKPEEPNIDKVILESKCYRLDSLEIIKKIPK
jgi:signal peptidase I